MDMSDARITAKDIKDKNDMEAAATEFLWATLNTHLVMEEYLNKNFEDHPAFVSVITRFVTNNNFKTSEENLEAKVKNLEGLLKSANRKCDSLISRLEKLEKK